MQGLPDNSAKEKARKLNQEAFAYCPLGAGLAGTLFEESKNKGGVHWRQIESLVYDPFVQRDSGDRMARCFELGLGVVGAVSFHLREVTGLVLYLSRTTADVELLRSDINEQYMVHATDLIGANYKIRKARSESAKFKHDLYVESIRKAKQQILLQSCSNCRGNMTLASLVLDGKSIAQLRSKMESEEQQNSVEDEQKSHGVRLAAQACHLGKQVLGRFANSGRKWRGAGLRGPPRQSLFDASFVLVGVFVAMLVVLEIADVLGEADPRFGFSAEWYSSTLCIMYALTPAPVGQPPQIIAAHLWNMLVGMACRQIPSPQIWKQALAVALGVSGQGFLGILHPPATGLSLAFVSDPMWTWTTLVAVCLADCVIVVISVLYLNLSERKQFPLYWLGLSWGKEGGGSTSVNSARRTVTKGAKRIRRGITTLAESVRRHNNTDQEDAV